MFHLCSRRGHGNLCTQNKDETRLDEALPAGESSAIKRGQTGNTTQHWTDYKKRMGLCKHTILKRSDVLRLLRSLDCPWQMNILVTDTRWTEQLTQNTQPHSDPRSHCCFPTKVTSTVLWLADLRWELRLWKTSIMSRASCKYFASLESRSGTPQDNA